MTRSGLQAALLAATLLATSGAAAIDLSSTLEVDASGRFPVQVDRGDLDTAVAEAIRAAGHARIIDARSGLRITLQVRGNGEVIALGMQGVIEHEGREATTIHCVHQDTALLEAPRASAVVAALANFATTLAADAARCLGRTS
ncbi:hypothetical protein J2T57_001677 [Natronocella acetinitrilica]|uniref:Uncharacterized protein n=1 Tax=Natronocella acetinitrilica TaxID=414046 RepID=A0AAE3G2E7_9GAMM|nr:hypothetical protein [Natronocella acetinitrilica]MCP1674575.1 hypothetical protein [Natronocella acetinitrilica]